MASARSTFRHMSDEVFRIEADVWIAAPPERVWAVLTDFAGYPRWNPWVVEVTGPLADGTILALRSVHAPGDRPTPSRVRLVSAAFPEMRWEGGHDDASIFRGDRRFRCEPDGEGCRFVQTEDFTGAAANVIIGRHGARFRENFGRFNAALKKAAEAQAVST